MVYPSLRLLVVTADRPDQLACCLTSLYGQLPKRAVLDIWDNGKVPLFQDPVCRGTIEAGMELYQWSLEYHRQRPSDNIGKLFKEATDHLPDDLVLWTDDDCIWLPDAVYFLAEALEEWDAVEPVVVDLYDKGWSDFTGLERITVETGLGLPSPARHLYECGTLPFQVDFLSSILLCKGEDLRGHWVEHPVCSDIVSTLAIPGKKAVVPRAEVVHMSHARGESAWAGYSLPRLWKEGYIELRGGEDAAWG